MRCFCRNCPKSLHLNIYAFLGHLAVKNILIPKIQLNIPIVNMSVAPSSIVFTKAKASKPKKNKSSENHQQNSSIIRNVKKGCVPLRRA